MLTSFGKPLLLHCISQCRRGALLSLAIVLLQSVAHGQGLPIAFSDAGKIANLENGEKDEFISRVNAYMSNPLPANATKDTLLRRFVHNRFLLQYIALHDNVFSAPPGPPRLGAGWEPPLPNPATALLGNLLPAGLESNLINGLASFIADRAKQELVISMLSRFNDMLQDTADGERYADLRILFPQTAQSLYAVGMVSGNYAAYLDALKASFRADLDNLPSDLPRITGAHRGFFSDPRLCDMAPGIALADGIVNRFRNGDGAATIIAGIDPASFSDSGNIRPALFMLRDLSQSLRRESDNADWIDVADFRTFAANPTAMGVYAGLLLEQFHAQHLQFLINGHVIGADSLLNLCYDDRMHLNAYLLAFANATGKVRKAVSVGSVMAANLKAGHIANTDSATKAWMAYLTDNTLDLITTTADFSTLPGFSSLTASADLGRCVALARKLNTLSNNINTHDYRSALNTVFAFYSCIAQWPGATTTPYASGCSRHNYLSAAMADVYKFGSFVTLLSDTSAKQIENDLEQLVPAGTYRDKREHSCNIAINAYGGFFDGYEKIQGIDQPLTNPLAQLNTTGITAPVGLSISCGNFTMARRGHHIHSRWLHSGWSASVFISVIDLGVVTAFRYNNDNMAGSAASVSPSPSIQLKNVFSPGAFLCIGLPRSPLSLNLGAQLGPNLRSISTTSTGATNANVSDGIYWRYSASLCVDLPLINLHTSAR